MTKINYKCKNCGKRWSISHKDYENDNLDKMICNKCKTPVDKDKMPNSFIIASLN